MDEMTKSIQIVVNNAKAEESKSEGKETEEQEERKATKQTNFLGKLLGNAILKGSELIADGLKKTVKEGWKELTTMASYSLGSSLFQNSASRSTALTYGTSNAESYALNKAMNTLNLQSEEDLYYMNQNQQTVFAQEISKWTKFYEDAESSGLFDSIEEMNLEFKRFKDDMMIEITEFIMENKDEIMNAIRVIVNALKTIVKVVSSILSFMTIDTGPTSAAERNAKTSDIISNYSYGGNRSVKISVDNTFNGVSANDKNTLMNASELVYKQTIEAIKGGN